MAQVLEEFLDGAGVNKDMLTCNLKYETSHVDSPEYYVEPGAWRSKCASRTITECCSENIDLRKLKVALRWMQDIQTASAPLRIALRNLLELIWALEDLHNAPSSEATSREEEL
jgi:hypothetical protein